MIITRTTELADPLAIRHAVFVEEQGISVADEVDGRDPDCLHWIGEDAQGPVATLRVARTDDSAKVQRVAVLQRARGTGLGAALMRGMMADLEAEGVTTFVLGAQMDAIRFYEKLGFVAEGPIYDDAGLPHRDMRRTV